MIGVFFPDLAAAWTVIAWVAGLAIAPAFLAAAPFIAGSLRRRELWWVSGPARAERRVDPRCDRRAWVRTAVYSALLFAPGIIAGVLLAWTVVGLAVAATGLTSLAVAAAVVIDSPRLTRLAWLPATHAATLLAAAAYAFGATVVTHGLSARLALWALYATPWLLAQLVAGWQMLVAYRAQDGARRIARAAFSNNHELWLA